MDARHVIAGQADPPGFSGLLRSKLRPPRLPDHFVARPRLNERLAIGSYPITLVTAPAGSGKTLLLASWLTEATMPVAWLSLDDTDNDPAALWLGMVAALEQMMPSCGDAARAELMRAAPVRDVVWALLNSLEAAPPAARVLVVDDVHELDGPAMSSLSTFVQHLPSWLHVVLVGRTDPDIPLDRLRVRGKLAEVRFAELRLSASEAHDMLALLAPVMSDAELVAAAEASHGWAAGIQLTALAARSARAQLASVEAGSGNQLIHDYVWHEVLSAGDPDVVDVMMKVSIVERVNGPLAAAIAERDDAGDLLLAAESQGLFVSRVGADGWFRMHALVREALVNRLAGDALDASCHARAADWFERAGETPAALDHWLRAERPRDALRLVAARSTQLYDRGYESTILRTIEAIPADVATIDLASMIDYAVSLILVSRTRLAEAVQQTAWCAESFSSPTTIGQVASLQSVLATMSGDWTSGRNLAHEATTLLGATWSSDPAGRFAWNTLARGIALAECWDDKDPDVRDATFAMARDPERSVSLEGIRSLGCALAGQPVDAIRIAAGVHHAAAHMSILRSEIELAEAIARRELGDRAGLDTLRSIAARSDTPRLYCAIVAMAELTIAAADDGNVTLAIEELSRLDALVSRERAGVDARQLLCRAGVAAALAAGDHDEARRWTAELTDPFWAPVSRARVLLAQRDLSAARAELDRAVPRCVRHRVIALLLEARTRSDTDGALECVTDGVELASGHGLLQTVAAEGRELMELIERAAWRASNGWMDRLRRLVVPAGIDIVAGKDRYVEPLTERERDVVRLLPTRLTLHEIARELSISNNTLKFHLRVVYRKLGVNSRDEVAAIARPTPAGASRTGP